MHISTYTTLGLGGMARRMIAPKNDEELAAAIQTLDASGEPSLILGGGSNLVVSDAPFEGTVVYLGEGLKELRVTEMSPDLLRLSVGSGVVWDTLVAEVIARAGVGLECMSGIPGLVGGAPIQNIGAYGQEVDACIESVRAFDREKGAFVTFSRTECGFSYRHSIFKNNPRFVLTQVAFVCARGTESAPLTYAELVRDLGVQEGARAPLATVRERVIALRRVKGMVVDPADSDTRSAGSFFTNPIVPTARIESVLATIRARLGDVPVPQYAAIGGTKLAAGWLIERAGFTKGLRHGGVGISTKHALALVNVAGGTSTQLVELALRIRDGVYAAFGVELMPEPVFVGLSWPRIEAVVS